MAAKPSKPPPQFKKINVKDLDLNRVQDAVAFALNTIASIPLLDGRPVETETNAAKHELVIVLGTTPKNIAHKLGRAYRGWFIVDKNANADVWVDPAVAGVDPNPDVTKFVRLDASATVTVKLWVF